MKEYYATKTKLIILPMIPVFVFALVYFLFTVDHTRTSIAIAMYILMFVTTIMFGTLAAQHLKRLTNPILIIEEVKLTIVDGSFNLKVINDIPLTKLIICNDYITFVETEKENIILDKNEFKENTLAKVLMDLELLPFKEIIK